MALGDFIMDTMFEQSLFSDLSLAFFHSAFPCTMRFNVHRAIVGQSPFLRLLLNNTHRINSVDNTHSQKRSLDSDISQQLLSSQSISSSTLHLTIDLIEAMTLRGFLMTPSQHIIRRHWQSPAPTTKTCTNDNSNHTTRHILSTHLRFVLKWLYSMDRMSLIKTLENDDTLRVLCVAILFDLDTLVDACLERYTTHQLSINSIVSDLETICQLPRNHKAYYRLRDAALLLLLRYGPDHPQQLAQLPVDYMSDVLNADVLFIGCEYGRYQLLREVLDAYMRSMGKITSVFDGPLDQDYKRLSGFVHNSMFTPKQQQEQRQQHQQQANQDHGLPVLDGTSSTEKRKLEAPETSVNRIIKHKQRHLSRISFSSRVPFEKLVEDASSGGVIDKATILSYLLQTTVNYSNMTFDQLSVVRQDGIVDEGVVFKALWQREALERLLFPFNYQQSQQAINDTTVSSPSTPAPSSNHMVIPPFGRSDINSGMVRQETTTDALNGHGAERQVLLRAPQFRFSASVHLTLPSGGDCAGWNLAEFADTGSTALMSPGNSLSEQQSQHSCNVSVDSSRTLGKPTTSGKNGEIDSDADDYNFEIDDGDMELLLKCESVIDSIGKETNTSGNYTSQQQQRQQQQQRGRIYNKTIYTEPKYILGHWHRVRVEAQILPRSLLQIQDDEEDDGIERKKNNSKDESPVLVCRFELQRDCLETHTPSSQQQMNSSQYQSPHPVISSHQQSQYNSQRSATETPTLVSHYMESSQRQSKIHYSIYCLNQHDGLLKNHQVDPEDRVLVPVSEVTESNDPMEQSTGYIGQVMLNMDALENKHIVDVDMMVALEIFGFTNKCS